MRWSVLRGNIPAEEFLFPKSAAESNDDRSVSLYAWKTSPGAAREGWACRNSSMNLMTSLESRDVLHSVIRLPRRTVCTKRLPSVTCNNRVTLCTYWGSVLFLVNVKAERGSCDVSITSIPRKAIRNWRNPSFNIRMLIESLHLTALTRSLLSSLLLLLLVVLVSTADDISPHMSVKTTHR